MSFFKWFYPGMGVKRWIFLCSLGLSLLVLISLTSVKSLSQTNLLLAGFVTAILIFGVFLVVVSVKNMLRTFVRALMPKEKEEPLVDIVYQNRVERTLERAPRVVAIGGGTGLSALLQGLKLFTHNITAIVTVTDTGGSSGRLRKELDILPPGDIRNCLVALADQAPLMSELFQYRFEDGQGLKGHSFGNLFITALSKVTGDFDRAVKESSKVLAIRGRVIPSCLENVSLVATFEDGTEVEGETNITSKRKKIRSLRLNPEDCNATEEALDAIDNADIVILGPGSLYTSVLPNVLIPALQKHIIASDAYKVYVANVMTQPGETEHLTASDHIRVLVEHTNPHLIDSVIINNGAVPDSIVKRYEAEGASKVVLDLERIVEMGYQVSAGDVVQLEGQVRHHSENLAKLIFEKFEEFKEREDEDKKEKHEKSVARVS
ncbi:MAG: YvcK family protein [Candidatus Omnitrophica bacterium]|nr:YvcK family protein [Candidatus Omnitrophota bacterium]